MVSRKEFAISIGENINEIDEVLTQLKVLKKNIDDKKTDLAEYALVAGKAFLDEGRKLRKSAKKITDLAEQVDEIA